MRRYMLIALFALLVAASSGTLLRFGLVSGLPAWAQNYTAIRHAHSHLMYFGWGTLGIMALIWHFLPRITNQPLTTSVYHLMNITAVLALLSFPAFWINGYGPTQVGPVSLPLGSMISGMNGLTWIAFAILYRRATINLRVRPLPVQLWDWAIVLLIMACSGAFGLVILIVLDHPSHFLQQAMLHLFLDLFATGWFMLALLGLLWAWIGRQTTLPEYLPTGSVALFLAPTFFLGIAPVLVPEHIYWVSAVANVIAAVLLAWHALALWRYRMYLPLLARFGLILLGVQLMIALVLLWPGLWRWSGGTQLRVFYMHNLLLGWLSSVLLGLALVLWFPLTQRWRGLLAAGWVGGVSVMLIALLGVGMISVVFVLPASLWLHVAAWSTIPILGSIGVLVAGALLPLGETRIEQQHATSHL
jgi:hypothetical protein